MQIASAVSASSSLASHVHAVQRQHVQVHVQPQRPVAPLHEHHEPRVRVARAPQTEGPLRATQQLREQHRSERLDELRAERTLVPCSLPHVPRQRAHPLPHRRLRQHLLHQVRRRVRHPPRHARRTEASRLARERHHELLAAPRAREPHAPVLEQPAAQVPLDLTPHEARQPAAPRGEAPSPPVSGAHSRPVAAPQAHREPRARVRARAGGVVTVREEPRRAWGSPLRTGRAKGSPRVCGSISRGSRASDRARRTPRPSAVVRGHRLPSPARSTEGPHRYRCTESRPDTFATRPPTASTERPMTSTRVSRCAYGKNARLSHAPAFTPPSPKRAFCTSSAGMT
jgi:hypothetical protein